MSTKAYYPLSEIGKGKPGFSKTRSIIEAAFYGNNVVKVNTLKEAYDLAKNSPGTIVTEQEQLAGEVIRALEGQQGQTSQVKEFYEKYMSACDGKVTKRLADRINA